MENSKNLKSFSDRFSFEYTPWAVRLTYPKRHPVAIKRHCIVEMFRKNGKVDVYITEDDRDRTTKEKKLDFTDVMFQLRQAGYLLPPWIRHDDVTWYKSCLLDKKGRDIVYRAYVGERYSFALRESVWFRKELVFGDYRLRRIVFIEDHTFLIETGSFFDKRTWTLPFSLYPSLMEATPQTRQNYRLNKRRTVIYWPDLKERLFVKDAIVFGERLEKKPDGMSDNEFLEKPVSPRLI